MVNKDCERDNRKGRVTMGKVFKFHNMKTLEHAGDMVLEELQYAIVDAQTKDEHMKAGFLKSMLASYADIVCDVMEHVDPEKIETAQGFFEEMLEDVKKVEGKTDYELFEEYVNTKVIPYVFKHENFQEAFFTLKQQLEDNPHMTLSEAHAILAEFDFHGEFERTFMIAHVGAEMGAYPHKTVKDIYKEMTFHLM